MKLFSSSIRKLDLCFEGENGIKMLQDFVLKACRCFSAEHTVSEWIEVQQMWTLRADLTG